MVEAILHGNIVIAYDIGGIPEIIQNEINGFLVKSRDPFQLSNLIVDILARKNKFIPNIETMKKFDLNTMVAQVESEIIDVISK